MTLIANTKNKKLLILLITFIVFGAFVWYSRTTHTGEAVTIVSVNEENIVVRNYDGRTTTVLLPTGISKLINPNSEYFIQYKQRRWGQHMLVSIEPFPDKSLE